MKHVMTYRAVEDFLPLAREHGPAHVERLREFHGRGGAADGRDLRRPDERRRHGHLTSREAAEEFIAGDPFVVHGVVASWSIRPWNEVLQPG